MSKGLGCPPVSLRSINNGLWFHVRSSGGNVDVFGTLRVAVEEIINLKRCHVKF